MDQNNKKKFVYCEASDSINPHLENQLELFCDQITYFDENPIFGYVYLASNTLNKKFYIGKVNYPKTIKKRWMEHLSKGRKLKKKREDNPEKKNVGRYLYNAIAKHGQDIWDLKQIDVAYNEKELNEKESYWIKEYNSFNPKKGYNMTEGGEGGKIRYEVKKKISKTVKELWLDPNFKELVKKGSYEALKNPEYHKKMSLAQKKLWQNPEYRKIKSESISKSIKQKWQNSEYRESVTKSLRDTWQKEENQNKRKDLSKKMWQDPIFKKETSKKISISMKKVCQDPVYKKMKSEKMIQLWNNPKYRKKVKKYKKMKEIEDDMLFDETERTEWYPTNNERKNMLRAVKCANCEGNKFKLKCKVRDDYGCYK